MQQIGEIFSKKRIEKGWTLKKVAAKVGITTNQYHAYEKNKYVPNAYTFLDICEVLNLKFSDFA